MVHSVGTTIGANTPKAGGWSYPNPASWDGVSPPAAPTSPPIPNTRS